MNDLTNKELQLMQEIENIHCMKFVDNTTIESAFNTLILEKSISSAESLLETFQLQKTILHQQIISFINLFDQFLTSYTSLNKINNVYMNKQINDNVKKALLPERLLAIKNKNHIIKSILSMNDFIITFGQSTNLLAYDFYINIKPHMKKFSNNNNEYYAPELILTHEFKSNFRFYSTTPNQQELNDDTIKLINTLFEYDTIIEKIPTLYHTIHEYRVLLSHSENITAKYVDLTNSTNLTNLNNSTNLTNYTPRNRNRFLDFIHQIQTYYIRTFRNSYERIK